MLQFSDLLKNCLWRKKEDREREFWEIIIDEYCENECPIQRWSTKVFIHQIILYDNHFFLLLEGLKNNIVNYLALACSSMEPSEMLDHTCSIAMSYISNTKFSEIQNKN